MTVQEAVTTIGATPIEEALSYVVGVLFVWGAAGVAVGLLFLYAPKLRGLRRYRASVRAWGGRLHSRAPRGAKTRSRNYDF